MKSNLLLFDFIKKNRKRVPWKFAKLNGARNTGFQDHRNLGNTKTRAIINLFSCTDRKTENYVTRFALFNKISV